MKSLMTLALLLCLSSTAMTWVYHGRVVDRIDKIERDITAVSIKTTWCSGGQDHCVETVQQIGETPEETAERHKENVEAAQKIFPPDC